MTRLEYSVGHWIKTKNNHNISMTWDVNRNFFNVSRQLHTSQLGFLDLCNLNNPMVDIGQVARPLW